MWIWSSSVELWKYLWRYSHCEPDLKLLGEWQKLNHKESLLYIQNMYLVNHYLCLISKSQNTATCFMLLCTASRIIPSPAQFPCVHLSLAAVTCSDSLSALSTPHIASAWDWSFPSPSGIADVSAALICHTVHLDVSEIPAWHVLQSPDHLVKTSYITLWGHFKALLRIKGC